MGAGGGAVLGFGFIGRTREPFTPGPKIVLGRSYLSLLLLSSAKCRDQTNLPCQLGTPPSQCPPPHPLFSLQCLRHGPAQGRVRRQTQVGEQDAPIPGSAFYLLPPGRPIPAPHPCLQGPGLPPWPLVPQNLLHQTSTPLLLSVPCALRLIHGKLHRTRAMCLVLLRALGQTRRRNDKELDDGPERLRQDDLKFKVTCYTMSSGPAWAIGDSGLK